MRRFIILLLTVFIGTGYSNAVLKEKDLNQTLSVLRVELENLQHDQAIRSLQMQENNLNMRRRGFAQLRESQQVALMLYSQKIDYIFDITYACHEATTLYNNFNKNKMPFDKIMNSSRIEIERYQALIESLQKIHDRMINEDDRYTEEEKAQCLEDRDVCIQIAQQLLSQQQKQLNEIAKDQERYEFSEKKLKELNDYAEQRYIDIRNNIFINGNDSYIDILSNLPRYWRRAKRGINEKYVPQKNINIDLNLELTASAFQDSINAMVRDSSMTAFYKRYEAAISDSTINEFMIAEKMHRDSLMSDTSLIKVEYDSIKIAKLRESGTRLKRIITEELSKAENDKNTVQDTQRQVNSEWRGPIIIMLFSFIIFYIIIASGLSYLVIRWMMKDRFITEESKRRRPYIILASTVLVFAVVVMILRLCGGIRHNFFLMASKLLIEYAWLIGTLLVSLLIRIKAEQIHSGFRIYIPVLLTGFIIIFFRIIFIPNELVSLIFPPILLIFTIWQWTIIRKHNSNIPRVDYIYSWISLTVMIVTLICSWYGYTLLAVQTLIWWLMMLTAIQTITCIYDLLSVYGKKKFTNKTDISKTWFYDFIRKALVPILAVYSLMLSIYWAAGVFDMTEWCKKIFNYPFINIPNVAIVSLTKLFLCTALFFITKYLINIGKKIYYKARIKKYGSEKKVVSLGVNVATLLAWAVYGIIVMLILKINNTAVTVIIGGLSTGIGFAMKDTLENLFYGISLMTGRVNIGDIIECDGIRGKVTNINYQATMVEPVDGSVMAFLNSQLFQKNFKNLTRNHGDELVSIPVGVAYGTNVEKARNLVLERIKKLSCYNNKKEVSILFDNFGDNSVDLILKIWVPVFKKVASIAELKENIYNVFNENGIEIPFPQRDVYVRKIDS